MKTRRNKQTNINIEILVLVYKIFWLLWNKFHYNLILNYDFENRDPIIMRERERERDEDTP